MPKAQVIQINWQFTGSAGIMQVEHSTDCFGGAWFKLPLSTVVWHPCHIWRETAFQFAEVLALNGETYVVSVNEFSATCNWQVIGVQVEQNLCKDRAWGRNLPWSTLTFFSITIKLMQDNKLILARIIINNTFYVTNNIKWTPKQNQSKFSSLPILSGCYT